MSNIIKSVKLDFSLLRSYPVTICFFILLPFLITVFTLTRSLEVDIFFVMLVFAIATGYPFFIVEKNSVERLYGILPIRKKEFVIGRYIFIICIGLIALIMSLIIRSVAFLYIGRHVSMWEILHAAAFGIFIFSLFASVQLPGYYFLGAIKGQALSVFPAAGLLLFLYLVHELRIDSEFIRSIVNSPYLIVLTSIVFAIVMFAVSMTVSIRIFNKKEI